MYFVDYPNIIPSGSLYMINPRRNNTFMELQHYLIRKKLAILKNFTLIGNYWNLLCVFLSILASLMYIIESYYSGYENQRVYQVFEEIIIFIFTADFIMNWIIADSNLVFFRHSMTWVDILTIIPTLVQFFSFVSSPSADGKSSVGKKLSIFRFARLLRLVRIMKALRAPSIG
jgi:hypothetical protein